MWAGLTSWQEKNPSWSTEFMEFPSLHIWGLCFKWTKGSEQLWGSWITTQRPLTNSNSGMVVLSSLAELPGNYGMHNLTMPLSTITSPWITSLFFHRWFELLGFGLVLSGIKWDKGVKHDFCFTLSFVSCKSRRHFVPDTQTWDTGPHRYMCPL